MRRLMILLAAAATLAAAQDWVSAWGPYYPALEGYDVVTTPSGGVFALGMGGWDSIPYETFRAVVRYGPDGIRTHVARFYDPRPYRAEFDLVAMGDHLLVGAAGSSQWFQVFAANDEGDSLWWDEYAVPSGVQSIRVSLTPDGLGNFYAIGPTRSESTGTDIDIYKYQPSGNVVWHRKYSGPYASGADYVLASAVDSAGNLYIAGLVRNRLQKRKPAVVKYRADGTFEWLHMFGPETENSGDYQDIAYSPGGYIYASGLYGDAGMAPVVKLRTNGDTVWTRSVEGVITDLAVDSHDNLYIAGHKVQYHQVRKFSPDGALLWTWQPAEEPLGNDALLDIAVGGNDCPVVCGTKYIDAGIRRSFVAKLTPQGETLWTARPWEGTSGEAREIALDAESSIYITGVGGSTWYTAKYRTTGPGVTELPTHDQLVRACLQVLPSVAARGCRLQVPDGSGCGGLRVVDVTGRAVRSFGPVAGGRDISWDLRDDAGAAVANGVYLVVADGPDSPAPARIIVQR